MPNTHTFICVSCPVGCTLTVEEENGVISNVVGQTCPRGERYAESELKDPRRVFAGTVAVKGGTLPVCPVRSKGGVPKRKLPEVAKAVSSIMVEAPVAIGQVIIPNVCESGIDIIASRTLAKREEKR